MTTPNEHPATASMENYRGYAGLPPLAGLLTMNEATAKGLTVSESVERLKRFHWALKRLHAIFVARHHLHADL